MDLGRTSRPQSMTTRFDELSDATVALNCLFAANILLFSATDRFGTVRFHGQLLHQPAVLNTTKRVGRNGLMKLQDNVLHELRYVLRTRVMTRTQMDVPNCRTGDNKSHISISFFLECSIPKVSHKGMEFFKHWAQSKASFAPATTLGPWPSR